MENNWKVFKNILPVWDKIHKNKLKKKKKVKKEKKEKKKNKKKFSWANLNVDLDRNENSYASHNNCKKGTYYQSWVLDWR